MTTINYVGTFKCMIILLLKVISANNLSYNSYQHCVFPHNTCAAESRPDPAQHQASSQPPQQPGKSTQTIIE